MEHYGDSRDNLLVRLFGMEELRINYLPQRQVAVMFSIGTNRDGTGANSRGRAVAQMTALLWKQGLISHIISTGAQCKPGGITEAESMAQVVCAELVGTGTGFNPNTNLTVMNSGLTTETIAVDVLSIMDARGWKSAAAVAETVHAHWQVNRATRKHWHPRVKYTIVPSFGKYDDGDGALEKVPGFVAYAVAAYYLMPILDRSRWLKNLARKVFGRAEPNT